MLAEKGKTAGYYLHQVGGITQNAEEDQIYVVRANGTVLSKAQEGSYKLISWDNENALWRGDGFGYTALEPGDTIIVPKKVERYPWLGTAKDITQILFQIAVSAGVVIAAF